MALALVRGYAMAHHRLALVFFYFSEKTSLDISCELSAKQTIHMKCQDLVFSEK